MGFMKGTGAVRRTLPYLKKGEVILRDPVKVVAFQHCTGQKYSAHHEGLRGFVYWHLPQLKFKNPAVQFVTFRNMTPTPWIKAYLADESQILIDCDSRSKEDILQHVKAVLGKSYEILREEEAIEISARANPANFGSKLGRQCICEVPGQMYCPKWTPLPKELTGKYQRKLAFEKAEAEG